jgi:hypothetical protein
MLSDERRETRLSQKYTLKLSKYEGEEDGVFCTLG